MIAVDLIKKILCRRCFLSFFFGSLVFILLTGGSVFLPFNDDWLMIGDAALHQISWQFFRDTAILQWPLGLNPSFGLVFSSSIVFSDSIPLASFLFKPFSLILGSSFQYFGFWIWLCFVLQFYFSHRIISKFSTDQLAITLSSLFFVISPPFLYRMIHDGSGHIALVSHFLILAAIDLYLDGRVRSKAWITLLSGGVLIQAYFVPMLLAIWVANLIRNIHSKRQTPRRAAIHLFSGLTIMLLVAWAAGYFVVGSSLNPAGWDYVFRWQPLSLVDSGTDGSTGWSFLLRDSAQLLGDTEAFSYLGSGVLLLAVIVSTQQLIFLSKNWSKFSRFFVLTSPLIAAVGVAFLRKSIDVAVLLKLGAFLSLVCFFVLAGWRYLKVSNKDSRTDFRPLIVSLVLLAIYSLTNRIGISTRQLVEYPLLPGFKQFTQTFRTHGRFIWPAFYAITFLIIIRSVIVMPKRFRSLLLAGSLLFQIVDSAKALDVVRHRFTDFPVWSSQLKDSQWRIWANKYNKILVVPPLNNDSEDLWLSISEFAVSNGMTTNSGYFTRFDTEQYELESEILIKALLNGAYEDRAIYLVLDSTLWMNLLSNPQIDQSKLKTVDSLHVLTP